MLFHHVAIAAMLAQPEFIVRDLKSRALALIAAQGEGDPARFEAGIWKAARGLPEASCSVPSPGSGSTGVILLKQDKVAVLECDVASVAVSAAQLAIRRAVQQLAASNVRIGISGPPAVAALAARLNPQLEYVIPEDGPLPDWKAYVEADPATAALDPTHLIPGVLRYGPPSLATPLASRPAVAMENNAIDPGPLPEPKRLTMSAKIARKQRLTFEVESGFRVPVDLYRPGPEGGDHSKGVLFALSDKGKASLEQDPFIIEAHERGWMVFAIDPRGIGELDTGVPDFVARVSTLLGEDFCWRQASDAARIISFAGRASVNQQSGLYAVGERATAIALRAGYLAGSGHVEWMILRGAAAGLQQRDAELIKAQTAGRVLFAPMDQPASFPE